MYSIFTYIYIVVDICSKRRQMYHDPWIYIDPMGFIGFGIDVGTFQDPRLMEKAGPGGSFEFVEKPTADREPPMKSHEVIQKSLRVIVIQFYAIFLDVFLVMSPSTPTKSTPLRSTYRSERFSLCQPQNKVASSQPRLDPGMSWLWMLP